MHDLLKKTGRCNLDDLVAPPLECLHNFPRWLARRREDPVGGQDNLAIYHRTAVARSQEIHVAQWMAVKVGCCDAHLPVPLPA